MCPPFEDEVTKKEDYLFELFPFPLIVILERSPPIPYQTLLP